MTQPAYLRNKLGDKTLKDTAFTTAPVYVSLHTGYPGAAGANEVVAGGYSYARQQVAAAGWNAFANGVGDNVNAVTWNNLPAVTVVAVGFWDALAGGNFLRGAWLSTVKRVFTITDLAGNLFASPAHGLSANDRIAFDVEELGTLPGGVDDTTLYWLIATGLTADAFKISASQGGAEMEITAVGAGKIRKVLPQVVNAGGTFQFNAGALDLVVH